MFVGELRLTGESNMKTVVIAAVAATIYLQRQQLFLREIPDGAVPAGIGGNNVNALFVR